MDTENNKILYEEYSGEFLIQLLKEKNPGCKHPRLLVTEEKFADIAAKKESDPFIKSAWESERRAAEEYLDAPVTEYEIYDGIRLLERCRAVLARVRTLAMVYRVTGEEKYAKRAWIEMEAAAGYPDWNPYHFLDVGEMCAALAIGYDWLYQWMTPSQRQIIRDAIIEKGMQPVMRCYLDLPRKFSFDWCNGQPIDNWTFVCNGGVAMAALAVGDEGSEEDEKICGEVISYSLLNMERAFWLFSEDGAWREGLTYWEYATIYFAQHLASLETALGSDFGRFREPGLSKSADFVAGMNGSAEIFNFSDCGKLRSNWPSQMLWFAKKLNRPEIGQKRIREVLADRAHLITDLIWYDEEFFRHSESQMPLDYYSKTIETLTMRSSWEEDAIFVGFHGGYNRETHAHLDAGSFVLDALGERFIMDPGPDNYNLGNTHPKGIFACYRYRAEGHNTLVIAPDAEYDQPKDGNAYMIRFENAADEAVAVCNMTDAYRDKAKRVCRTMALTEGRSKVVLTDEIQLLNPAEIYWFAHTDADISLAEDGKSAVLIRNGKKMLVRLCAQAGAESTGMPEGMKFEVMDAVPLPTSPVVPGQNPNKGIRKLSLHAEQFCEGNICVEFVPMQ